MSTPDWPDSDYDEDDDYADRIHDVLGVPDNVQHYVYITKPGLEIVRLNLTSGNSSDNTFSKDFPIYDEWIGQERRTDKHVEEGGSRAALDYVDTKYSAWRVSSIFNDNPTHTDKGEPWLWEIGVFGQAKEGYSTSIHDSTNLTRFTAYEEWLYTNVHNCTRQFLHYKECLAFHFHVVRCIKSRAKFNIRGLI